MVEESDGGCAEEMERYYSYLLENMGSILAL
jgi:hypothetical protein